MPFLGNVHMFGLQVGISAEKPNKKRMIIVIFYQR